ncbi:MAG: hypothetical protein WC325_11085 [Candidatus Bathyarchaeia archaeon]|jgi:hypothetical protein
MDIKIPKPNFEHNKIFENLPLIFIFSILGLMMIPAIPAQVKSALMIVGMVGLFPSMYLLDVIARDQSIRNNVIKARIMPYKIEREFHIEKAIGRTNSTYDPYLKKYVTPFRLAVATTIKELGVNAPFKEIIIEHTLPFDERNKPNRAWVHWNGIEIQHPNVYLVELWYTGDKRIGFGSSADYLEFVPRFSLESGTEDYWILKGKTLDTDFDNMEDAVVQ